MHLIEKSNMRNLPMHFAEVATGFEFVVLTFLTRLSFTLQMAQLELLKSESTPVEIE